MKKIFGVILLILMCSITFAPSRGAMAKGVVHARLDGVVKQGEKLYFTDGRGMVEYNIKTKKQSRILKSKKHICGVLYYKGNLYYSQLNKKYQYECYCLHLKTKQKSLLCKNVEISFIKNDRIYFDERLDIASEEEDSGEALHNHEISSVNLNGEDRKTHLEWAEEHHSVACEFHIYYRSGRYYFGDFGEYSVDSNFSNRKTVKNSYEKACKVFHTNFSASSKDFDGKLIYLSNSSTSGPPKWSDIIYQKKGKSKTVYQSSKKKNLSLLACDYGYLVIKEGKNTYLLNKHYKKVAKIKK